MLGLCRRTAILSKAWRLQQSVLGPRCTEMEGLRSQAQKEHGAAKLYVKHRSWVGMEISEIPLRAVATLTKIADTIEVVSYIKLR